MLLDEIVAAKRVSIANIKSEQFEPFLNDLEPPRDLFSALMNPAGRMAVIADRTLWLGRLEQSLYNGRLDRFIFCFPGDTALIRGFRRYCSSRIQLKI